MRKILYVIIALILALYSCSNKEEISNKFRSDNRNSGIYLSEPIGNEPTQLWKFKTNGRIHASVAYDGKNVFIGSEDQMFYSLDALTGDLNWEFKTEGSIYSTAVIDGNYIYFSSYDGFLYKLNKNSGDLVWKFETEGEKVHFIKNYYDFSEMVPGYWDFYQSSPLISGNQIYFGAGTNFYAVDKNTGTESWKFKTEGVVHSSPAMYENKIVFGSFDSRVYCLDKENGKNLWTYETGRDTTQYIWLGVQASPLISDGKVYIGSRDAKIYTFDLNTGDTLWTNNKFEMSWMPSSFADGEDMIYSGSSDGFSFYAIDKATGKINYQINTNSYTFSSPAINSKMAYIGSANGRLYGIDLDKESIEWEFLTEGVNTDTLKVFNDQGEMDVEVLRSLFKELKIDSYQELYNFYKMYFKSVGAILSSPAVHNRVIYFGSCDGYVYAITGN